MTKLRAYAVLFDVDGTLLDTAEAYLEITRRACRSLGWPAPPASLIREVILYGRSTLDVLFGKDGAADPDRRAVFQREVERWWQVVFPARSRIYPDVISTLRELSSRGFRLGIVTDAESRVVQRLTSDPRLPAWDTVVSQHDISHRKPSPRSLRKALHNMGLHPDAAVYIGDHAVDVRAGKLAGLQTVALRRHRNADELLSLSRADLTLSELRELPSFLRWIPPIIEGSVQSGVGVAPNFLNLPWVHHQLVEILGAPPFPGTLNLTCTGETAAVVRRMVNEPRLRRLEIPPESGFCRALCYEVALAPTETSSVGNASARALLLRPDVPGYPATQLEIVGTEHFRSRWHLRNGDRVLVRYLPDTSDKSRQEP